MAGLAVDPGRRADEHEAPVARGRDLAQEAAGRQERGGEVGGERLLPPVERQLPEWHVLLGPDAGDGGADVEAAELPSHLGEEAVGLVLVPQVGLEEHGALAVGCDRFGTLAALVEVHADAGALGSERAGAGGADPPDAPVTSTRLPASPVSTDGDVFTSGEKTRPAAVVGG